MEKEKVKNVVVAIGRFIGTALAIDAGLFVLVSLSCLIGTRCSYVAYSERMFWVGMAALIAAMPAVLASLSSNRGYFDNPFTAGADMQVAHTIIKDARLSLNKRAMFALRMGIIGSIAIAISAVIEIMGRPG
jgi:hypothetical protein